MTSSSYPARIHATDFSAVLRALRPGRPFSPIVAALGVIMSIGIAVAADSASRFARLEGMRVHYMSYGKGADALVFIHGWACNHGFWKAQIPAFEKRTRVLAIDLPGHGESDAPRIRYSMDLFARAIDGVMKDAGVKTATLVGHSMGTPVIRQFSRLYPAKTRALVVVDGALRPFADAETMDKFVAPLRGPDFPAAAARMIDGMLQPVQDQAERAEIRSQMLRVPQHVAVSAMEAMNDPEIWRHDKIIVPVLALYAKSPAWSPEYEQFVRGLVTNLDFQVMDGVSHFLMMDKPREFNDALAAFLQKKKLIRK